MSSGSNLGQRDRQGLGENPQTGREGQKFFWEAEKGPEGQNFFWELRSGQRTAFLSVQNDAKDVHPSAMQC